MTAFYQIWKVVINSWKSPNLIDSICVVGAVGMIPVRVPEMVPFRVPEIVPDRVPEIVPLLVPDIVPAKPGVETARANIVAHTMDLAFFIVLLLMFQTSWVIRSAQCS